MNFSNPSHDPKSRRRSGASARPPQEFSDRDSPARFAGKCLVTGATGFIGSHLVRRLIRRGYDIRVLARTSSSMRWIEGLPVEIAYGDLRDKASIAGICVGVRNVFHFGANLGATSASDFDADNDVGSRYLAEALAERGETEGFFVNCSSIAAGGPALATASQALPVRREDHADTPISAYGRSKLAGELAVFDVARECGTFRAVSLRPPVVYGPRGRGVHQLFTWVKRGILPLLAPPGARLSMIHVDDLVTATIQVAEQEVEGAYYVSDGDVHTWTELGHLAAELMGSTELREIQVPELAAKALAFLSEGTSRFTNQPPALSREKLRQFRQPHWVSSSKKAIADWSFSPTIELEDGFEQTVGWYRQHGWL